MTKSEPLRSPNEYKIYVERWIETMVNSPKPISILHRLLPKLARTYWSHCKKPCEIKNSTSYHIYRKLQVVRSYFDRETDINESGI